MSRVLPPPFFTPPYPPNHAGRGGASQMSPNGTDATPLSDSFTTTEEVWSPGAVSCEALSLS